MINITTNISVYQSLELADRVDGVIMLRDTQCIN